jgi:DNA-binding NarL/FixJ family response regulator
VIPFVTVLIAEGEATFRQSAYQALVAAAGLHVVGVADSVSETIELARLLQPDAILLDAALLNGDGVQAAEAGLFMAGKVLLVAEAGAEASTLQLFQLGARGCLEKGDGWLEKLPEAIRAVHRGEAVLSPRLTGRILNTLQH